MRRWGAAAASNDWSENPMVADVDVCIVVNQLLRRNNLKGTGRFKATYMKLGDRWQIHLQTLLDTFSAKLVGFEMHEKTAFR